MADNEVIRYPLLAQPSARSAKLRIYESLFNQGVDHLVSLVHSMEELPLADKGSMQSAIVEIEEIRCDMNADFTEQLADRSASTRVASGGSDARLKRNGATQTTFTLMSDAARKSVGSRDCPRVFSAPSSRILPLLKRKKAGKPSKSARKRTPRNAEKPLRKQRALPGGSAMAKKSGPKNPKVVWVGSTPVTRISAKEQRKLAEQVKQRHEHLRTVYPEVHGKVVDFITHTITDGTLYFSVHFKDKTNFSIRYGCEMFVVGMDLSDWRDGNYNLIREYMKPIPR
jgi:hypothetical protein